MMKGFFGRGPWRGRHGFGPGRGRVFGKGDLKYVILDLLKERPAHGYELIRALEERFRGFYSPSPGSVYPTLQLLEDLGHVTVVQRDGKKVYTITEQGREFLEEHRGSVEEIWGRAGGPRPALRPQDACREGRPPQATPGARGDRQGRPGDRRHPRRARRRPREASVRTSIL